jgi:hypothetical protein
MNKPYEGELLPLRRDASYRRPREPAEIPVCRIVAVGICRRLLKPSGVETTTWIALL